MLTDRDIVRRGIACKKDPNTKVDEIKSSGIHHIDESASVNDAARYMKEHKIRRLVVTNAEKKFSGILSLGDLSTSSDLDLQDLAQVFYEIALSDRKSETAQ